jgi:hypothetical protein
LEHEPQDFGLQGARGIWEGDRSAEVARGRSIIVTIVSFALGEGDQGCSATVSLMNDMNYTPNRAI